MKKVVLDLDAVLHSLSTGWHLRPDMMDDPVPDADPVPGAVEFCNWLFANKYTPIVYSARLNAGGYLRGLVPIRKWLEEHRFPWMQIAIDKPQECLLIVDDKGFRFEGDFEEVKEFLTGYLAQMPSTWATLDYDARQQPGIWVGERTDCFGKKRIRATLGQSNGLGADGRPCWRVSRVALGTMTAEAWKAVLDLGLTITGYDRQTDFLLLQLP